MSDPLWSTWLLLSVEDEVRIHAGHQGYEDEKTSVYHYDNKVPKHGMLQVGHRFVLRDDKQMLGIGQIVDLISGPATKKWFRCPQCNISKIKDRKKVRPIYRCRNGHVFDVPLQGSDPITSYKAYFGHTFRHFPGAIPLETLQASCIKPKSQHSIRKLKFPELAVLTSIPEELRRFLLGDSSLNLAAATADEEPEYLPDQNDQRERQIRAIKARRGQQAFRNALRQRYGDRCMISGSEIMDVVEAAHIAPYRGQKDHAPTNGLLLRSDLHTLYDLDLLGIDPQTLMIHLQPSLSDSGYTQFNQKPLMVRDGIRPGTVALEFRWSRFTEKRTHLKSETASPSSAREPETLPSSTGPTIFTNPAMRQRWNPLVPKVPLKAAAGAFSESQEVGMAMLREAEDWLDPGRSVDQGWFAAEVQGHSMEPVIMDGDLCLFSPIGGAGKQNRIVLAALWDEDSEHGGRYTVKVYKSEKGINANGTPFNRKVILSPRNKAFQPMVYTREDEDVASNREPRVIGLFREVL